MSDEQFVTFGNDISERAYLPTAGKYGHGLDYEADVDVVKFEWDTATKPAYAGEDESFALFQFKIVYDGKTIFHRHQEPIDPGSGSRVKEWLLAMGVDVTDQGDESFGFKPSDVAPRKLTGIEVGDPVQSKRDGRWFTGNLRGVGIIG